MCVIAGPCVLESLELGLEVGERVRDLCAQLGFGYVFKASYDKANRSSVESPRGPGIERGLGWLSEIRERLGVPVTTDVHEPSQAAPVARAVDLLQIPAFLCRQTDLLVACAQASGAHGRAVNVKKGQFVSPAEMQGPIGKLESNGCTDWVLTERGTFFGYGRLVNDFLGVAEMMELGPVCFDVTHSTQHPGQAVGGKETGGSTRHSGALARAAAALGVDALFIETHPDPASALSDKAVQVPLGRMADLLGELSRVVHR